MTATDVDVVSSGTSFTIRAGSASRRVRTRLLGRHAVGHVLAGVAVASSLGRSLDHIAAGVESLEPVEHRLQLIQGRGGVTVIDDAYNSNPDGAAVALEVLRSMPGNKKVVVTPGMIELGPLGPEENERLGERAAAVADVLIAVAKTNRESILAGAGRAATGCEVIAVDSLAEAQEKLAARLQPGAVVLFENDLPDHYEG